MPTESGDLDLTNPSSKQFRLDGIRFIVMLWQIDQEDPNENVCKSTTKDGVSSNYSFIHFWCFVSSKFGFWLCAITSFFCWTKNEALKHVNPLTDVCKPSGANK
jgi:hypothetical protein